MLPHISSPQRVLNTLVSHLRDDVVCQFDRPFDVVNLSLLTKQSYLHYSGCHLVPVRLPCLGIFELTDLAVVGVVQAACQVVVVRASRTNNRWVNSASDLQFPFVTEGIPTSL